MPHCRSCAAPLPAYSSSCNYCGVKNDVDLTGLNEYTVSETCSTRNCPVCKEPLETIGIEKMADFYIDRCPKCFGLFFDPEELNLLLDKTVDTVYSVNMQKIHVMNQLTNNDAVRPHAYIKCPVGGEVMNRVNFGGKSGVVIDQCRHGIWLDSGELLKLLEWRKAGGQLLHEEMAKERTRQEAAQQAKKRQQQHAKSVTLPGLNNDFYTPKSSGHTLDIIELTVRVVGELFK